MAFRARKLELESSRGPLAMLVAAPTEAAAASMRLLAPAAPPSARAAAATAAVRVAEETLWPAPRLLDLE